MPMFEGGDVPTDPDGIPLKGFRGGGGGPPGGGPGSGPGGGFGFSGGIGPQVFRGMSGMGDNIPLLARKRGINMTSQPMSQPQMQSPVMEGNPTMDMSQQPQPDMQQQQPGGYATGGMVPGVTPGPPQKGDTSPAMLTPGEIVMNTGVTSDPTISAMLTMLNIVGAHHLMKERCCPDCGCEVEDENSSEHESMPGDMGEDMAEGEPHKGVKKFACGGRVGYGCGGHVKSYEYGGNVPGFAFGGGFMRNARSMMGMRNRMGGMGNAGGMGGFGRFRQMASGMGQQGFPSGGMFGKMAGQLANRFQKPMPQGGATGVPQPNMQGGPGLAGFAKPMMGNMPQMPPQPAPMQAPAQPSGMAYGGIVPGFAMGGQMPDLELTPARMAALHALYGDQPDTSGYAYGGHVPGFAMGGMMDPAAILAAGGNPASIIAGMAPWQQESHGSDAAAIPPSSVATPTPVDATTPQASNGGTEAQPKSKASAIMDRLKSMKFDEESSAQQAPEAVQFNPTQFQMPQSNPYRPGSEYGIGGYAFGGRVPGLGKNVPGFGFGGTWLGKRFKIRKPKKVQIDPYNMERQAVGDVAAARQAGYFDPRGNQMLIRGMEEAAQGTADAQVRRQMQQANLSGLDPAQAAIAKQQALRETGRGVQDIMANTRAQALGNQDQYFKQMYGNMAQMAGQARTQNDLQKAQEQRAKAGAVGQAIGSVAGGLMFGSAGSKIGGAIGGAAS